MPELFELTRQELADIEDPQALEELLDEYDHAIVQIETQLEHRNADPDWKARAVDALAHKRFTRRLIRHRLDTVEPKLTHGTVRCEPLHPLASELLDGWYVDPESFAEVDGVRRAHDELVDRINALAAERDDEDAKALRDLAFIRRADTALRDAATLRSRLLERRGVLSKAEKMQAQATQERRFVDAARELLDQETYLAIWDRAKAGGQV